MIMFLVNDDDSKTKVDVSTLGGNRIVISRGIKIGETIYEMINPEILFFGDSIHITGYNKTEKDNVYKLETFVLRKR